MSGFVSAMDNRSGESVQITFSAETDEYPFIAVNVRTDDGRDVADILIKEEAEAELLIVELREAITAFKKL